VHDAETPEEQCLGIASVSEGRHATYAHDFVRVCADVTWPTTGHVFHAAADSFTDDGLAALLRTRLRRRISRGVSRPWAISARPTGHPLLRVAFFVDEGAPLRLADRL
jgi:hypothetical protein